LFLSSNLASCPERVSEASFAVREVRAYELLEPKQEGHGPSHYASESQKRHLEAFILLERRKEIVASLSLTVCEGVQHRYQIFRDSLAGNA